MRKYVFLDHTADVLFEAYGKNLDELFTNAALALQEIQVKLSTVKPKQKHMIKVEGEKVDLLLFDFLQELIYIKDVKELLFSKFKVCVKKNTKYVATATCLGEKIDFKKHECKVDAKAITLHQFEVKKEKGHWKARVIVDI
jgi:SHS2 domain-containing protein